MLVKLESFHPYFGKFLDTDTGVVTCFGLLTLELVYTLHAGKTFCTNDYDAWGNHTKCGKRIKVLDGLLVCDSCNEMVPSYDPRPRK